MRRLSLLDDEKEEERKREKTREKKLYEAAMGGSIASLLEFLHEDLSSASDTPLHIAALLGRSDLAKELLGRRPQLAKTLNSMWIIASTRCMRKRVRGNSEGITIVHP